jgi:hypothetical protein
MAQPMEVPSRPRYQAPIPYGILARNQTVPILAAMPQSCPEPGAKVSRQVPFRSCAAPNQHRFATKPPQ